MNGETIYKIFETDPFMRPLFAGLSFSDYSPVIESFPKITILNTDCSTCPGEHWCAAYFPYSGKCEYFDPLGFNPRNPFFDLETQLLKHCSTIDKFAYQVQPETSTTCGHHCILFSFYKSRGFSKTFIENFIYSPTDLNQNDIRAITLVKKFGIFPLFQ